MLYKIEISEQERDEYASFLRSKKESLLKEVGNIEERLAKLFSTASEDVSQDTKIKTGASNSVRGSVGWKFKIDEVLKKATKPLTSNQILDKIIEVEPEIGDRRQGGRKSVSSTLSTNSLKATDRYIRATEKGIAVYSLNRTYGENEIAT